MKDIAHFVRAQNINANFLCTKFFDNPSGHGRPRRKSWTSAPKSASACGPGGGEKLLTAGHSGVRVRNVRRKSGPKKLCLCCFSSLILGVSQRPLTLIRLEKYCDTNGRRIVIQVGGVYTTFCQEEGIPLQKYRDRNVSCIAILFKSIGVRGRFDSPDHGRQKQTDQNCRKDRANGRGGFGSQTAADPPGDPRRTLKADCGYHDSIA